MKNQNGGKATIREVRDLIYKLDDEKISPMRLDIAQIKTLLTQYMQEYKEFCVQNQNEHKNFVTISSIKIISIILGVILTIITILNGYLAFFVR